jgi:hypothetical protein
MADGSQARHIEHDAAAADAAREARAEAPAKPLSVTKAKEAAAEAKAAKGLPAHATRQVKAGNEFHEFNVDVWITNFNSVEFGFWKRDRNKGKSRQFTSDMDIFAEVIENGERTGLLGYREELWKKKTGMDKRLVFKLFNESLNWRATMDLMLARSLQLSFGARGEPVIAFSANLNDHDFMIYLERSARKWPMLPENWSFTILEDGVPQFFRLRRDFFDFAGDYTLYNQRDEKIGRITGRLISFGKWRGRIKREAADKRLVMALQLFCGMIAFNRGLRKHIRSLVRDIASGTIKPKIEKQEADLYLNPRRVR